ncbi:trifunctional serine/threonine-protein kinase/ATP-binding protein/sensor histidine kinase [Aquabacter sp. P-9]|uniref:trifunctional serine/threonine-protein kinase/ATP-binding protein/sensor histidine kinase n=1 Tax=Aquabacter sediminis TaxID=3029197 RepID=UPI00237DFBD1|nr:ATP-binding sensor histidine kinase [Aquabacter sp. P-9]MDE1568625.1 AAA family ATPase [Aquabacter sp. P-9]
MNSSSHAPGVSFESAALAPHASYFMTHEIATRLPRQDARWWASLIITSRSTHGGIEELQVVDEAGAPWRILLAEWNTPQAFGLLADANLALTLGHELAEVPAFVGEQERLALVYPPRTATALADLPPEGGEIGTFMALALAASAALMGVHQAGIIHGGLSPTRLLVEPDGHVRFTGFTWSAGAQASAAQEHRIDGPDVAYAAPELIRTDPAPVDARTDLYALGVLLYERLSGHLPLTASSLSGWLHAHVAMQAPSLRLARPEIPASLDAILLKLISKDPKQRYQTARALHADFWRLATTLATTGQDEDFVLARGEFAEPPRGASQLFGRAPELARLGALYAAFRSASQRRIVLVTGEPGAGKSTLVEALIADIREGGALCASGKGVQLREGTPFAPIAQALRTALAHVLGGDEAGLAAARLRLGGVVGCGRVLADLVPDLTILPPESHPVADVPAHLAQVRAARILAQTFAALASADTPLVLFLDDLQWFDHASLNVVRQMCSEAPAHVFLIGSYRPEALNRKAVRELLEVARRAPAFAQELNLEPFGEGDTLALVAFILKSAPEAVQAIAARVHREARGNPFFIGQLLQTLLEEEVLQFDADRQDWTWNARRRRQQHEIADLMLERLNTLPPLQRSLLQRCATLGGRCSAAFAARLSGASLEETVRAANALVAAGLLHRSGTDFVVAHDRVLEAASASMSPAQKARKHLGNARALSALHPAIETDVAFDIASQVDHCTLEDLAGHERPHFARILLLAARACRSAGEAHRALHFVDLIRRILPEDKNEDVAALAFDAEWLECDCLLALGRVDEALAALDGLWGLRDDSISVAELCRLKATALTVKGAYAHAIDSALQGLRALDVELETSAGPDELEAAYRICLQKLERVAVEDLVKLPDITDRRARAALSLLSTLISSFFVEGELRFLHVIKIVELTLAHGAAPESAYGLAWFGVLAAHYFGAYEQGAAYATAATTLAKRDGYEAQRTAALIALDQVSPWTSPMRTALSHAREGARVAQAAGDLGMACYARNHIASDLLVIGARLDRVRSELVDSIAMTRDIGYGDIELILAAQLGLVEALGSGEPQDGASEAVLRASSVATRYWVRHYAGLQAFALGDLPGALRHLEEADAMAWAAPAHIDTAMTCFFLALARAQVEDGARSADERLGGMAVARERFRAWAGLNAETFSAKHLLLEAEAARLSGKRAEAMVLYERAAEAAAAARFVHDQALAQELAARFYRDINLTAPAQGCLQSAIQSYREWGANGKAAQLARLLPASAGPDAAAASPRRMQHELDLTVMAAASQTLAEEVGLEQVVRTLMKSMIIHAGAQFGLLLLLRNGAPVVEAVARVQGQEIAIALQPAATPEDLMPASVLKTVLRTARPVTLADAALEAIPRGLSLGGRAIRSLACIPLVKRGDLIGMLYLENALSADVFTPQRMAMLEVIAPQAAISLDAARLYGDLMAENLRRAQAEFELREARSDLARANQMTAMGSFASSIAHEINQPLASLVAHADAGLRWLNRPQPDFAEVSKSLQSIRQSGRRAADIITALRALVKQEPSALRKVAVEDVVEDVLKIIGPDMQSNRIELETTFSDARSAVLANTVQLQQVLFNIMTNAIQAMSGKNDGARRLHITTSSLDEAVQVEIEDTGAGMSPEVMARIFQPFFTTKSTGMGVGLAICRSIMELHGGALECRSAEGRGSTFVVRLPREG